MPGTPSITSLANECSLRCVQDFDYRYSVDRSPIDEAVFKDVVEIAIDLGPLWGFGVERVYNFEKKVDIREKRKTNAGINESKQGPLMCLETALSYYMET